MTNTAFGQVAPAKSSRRAFDAPRRKASSRMRGPVQRPPLRWRREHTPTDSRCALHPYRLPASRYTWGKPWHRTVNTSLTAPLRPKYKFAVKGQIGQLLSTKRSEIPIRIDPPSCQGITIDLGRDQERAITSKADVALVEQMVDVRAKQQPIVPVKLLKIGRCSPGFDVAGSQVAAVRNARDPTAFLHGLEILTEHPLSATRPHELHLLGFINVGSVSDCTLYLLFGRLRHLFLLLPPRGGFQIECGPLGAQKMDDGLRHVLWDRGEIGTLVTIPVRSDRGVFFGKRGSKDVHMVLRAQGRVQTSKLNRHTPTFVVPCIASNAKFTRLWCQYCGRQANSDGPDFCVGKGENHIARTDSLHIFVEFVSAPIAALRRRPEVVAVYLMGICLFVVYPPIGTAFVPFIAMLCRFVCSRNSALGFINTGHMDPLCSLLPWLPSHRISGV